MRSRRPSSALAGAAFAAALAVFGAAAALAQTSMVVFNGPLARVITPNGDQINDRAFFCFDNPQDSEISGKIYTLLGAEVGSMGPKTNRIGGGLGSACPTGFKPQFVSWDGTASGSRVSSGVYVYRIEVEGEVFSGTLLVVK